MIVAADRPTDGAQAPASALFARLRAATAATHRDVEAMVPLLDPALTVAQYRAFLATLWGVHRPLEQRLARVAGLVTVVPDLERRWKATLLAQDLDALGVEAAAVPVCEDGPALATIEDAVGCMYVLEGSTLGGQQLRRHLATVLPAVARDAAGFLGCYGAETGPRWNAFRGHVLTTAGLDEHAVVAAACATFATIRDWFARGWPPIADRSPRGAG